MLKNIFFDFDGTLVNTEEGIVNGVHFAFDKAGVARVSDAEISKLIGLPIANMFEIFFDTKDETRVADGVKWFREYYARQGVFESRLYDGTKDMLQQLKDSGFVLDVVSSKPAKFIEMLLSRLEISQFFTNVSGTGLSVRDLTKSERMKNFIDDFGLNTQGTIMVGDSIQDVIAANSNDVRCIGVTYGFGTKEDLLGTGAWKLASSPLEVAEIIISQK